MFDIGWSELVVIAVVALIAIGPKELPGVLRTVGQYMGKIRRMASEFQGQFQEAMREAEVSDLKKQVDEMTDAAKGFTDFDPLASVRKEVDSFAADPLGESSAKPSSPAAIAEQTSNTATSDAAIETAWAPSQHPKAADVSGADSAGAGQNSSLPSAGDSRPTPGGSA